MFRNSLLVAGTAGALILLVACGGGGGDDRSSSSATGTSDDARVQSAEPKDDNKPADGSATGDARTDMCRLISADEVSAILGESMHEGPERLTQTSARISLSQCTWLVDGSAANASVFQRKSTEKDAASTFDRGRNEYPDVMDVRGLGEGAYFIPSIGQLNVLDGDAWFIVSARKGHETTNMATDLTDHLMKLGELVVKKY